MAKFIVINAEMFIGAKFYKGISSKTFDPINGFSTAPVPVRRVGAVALGRYQPQDIGKRVYGNQVENEEQVTRRTGLSFETRKRLGEEAIAACRTKYDGEKNIWALTIRAPFVKEATS
jgi:hypothetical protein